MSAVENELRCNHLKCRLYVITDGKAVVTTCSDIFCIACANELFSNSEAQICPACEQVLSEPDDIVISCLNPSNDYKASILAGLTPSIILEIAARAMGFWTYQMSQESAFQALLLKNSQDKMAKLEQELVMVRGHLQNEQRRNQVMEQEVSHANSRTQDALQESREKDREMTRLRGNYDKIKRKALLGSVAQAVEGGEQHAPWVPPQHMHMSHQGPTHGTPSTSHPQAFVPTPRAHSMAPSALPFKRFQYQGSMSAAPGSARPKQAYDLAGRSAGMSRLSKTGSDRGRETRF